MLQPVDLTTIRLRLVVATSALTRAAAVNNDVLSHALRAQVPPSWPPPVMEDAQANLAEWSQREQQLFWYWLASDKPGGPLLIGCGGFKQQPDATGSIEVGYAVCDPYQRQGYATEAVRAMVDWAFGHNEVRHVSAETFPDLIASLGVLRNLGFQKQEGEGSEPGAVRYRLNRSGPDQDETSEEDTPR